jgi:hypothetical protein
MVAIIGIAFTGNVMTNQASTEMSAIDFVGLTSGSVDELSARRRAAHCGASHDRRLGHTLSEADDCNNAELRVSMD